MKRPTFAIVLRDLSTGVYRQLEPMTGRQALRFLQALQRDLPHCVSYQPMQMRDQVEFNLALQAGQDLTFTLTKRRGRRVAVFEAQDSTNP